MSTETTHLRYRAGGGTLDRFLVKVLVVNVGSSSVKLRLLDANNVLLYTETLNVDRTGVTRDTLETAISGIADMVDAIGHRIVHGGRRFTGPVLIDEQVEQESAGPGRSRPLAPTEIACRARCGQRSAPRRARRRMLRHRLPRDDARGVLDLRPTDRVA